MAAKIPVQKIADCRELYLRYGGQRHARIVAEMRARGWAAFTKRNLYVRTRNGRVEPGWPERFGWLRSEPPAVAGGLTRRRSKPGIAYSRRRTSARERTILDRPTAFETRKPKFNRQKARSLRKKGHAGNTRTLAGNAGALACTDAIASGLHADIHARHAGGTGVADWSADTLVRTDAAAAFGHNPVSPTAVGIHARHAGGTGVAGEGACAPGLNSATPVTSATPATTFHSWLKTLPSIWNWDARHQLYLYEHLQKVTDGTCKRLMIFMPPRHGKSELVTVRYTAWRLRQDPSLNVILASYGQDLANRLSRKIKRVLIDDFAVSAAREGVGEWRSEGVGEWRRKTPRSPRPRVSPTPSLPDSPTPPLPYSPTPGSSPFPFVRQRPANRVSEWETTMGGGLRAVGVGAGVTGYGAKLIVIDDPVKSREQANSLRFRNRLWDWFNDDLYTRLEPGGSIVLIQTRWHEDDLAGRLLKDAREGGEEWVVVNLPALAEREDDTETRGHGDAGTSMNVDRMSQTNVRDAESCDAEVPASPRLSLPASSSDPLGRIPGEALWPEMYGVEHFEEIRRRQGEFSFAALYQQRPVPAEGGAFKREWFKNIVDHAPAGLDWKRGYDLAVSTKQTADYTASFRVAYDKDNNLYIDGGFRRRIPFPEQKRYIAERLTLERDTEHGIELALHGEAVMQELRRDIKVQGRRFTGVRVKGDKQTRALKWQSLAAEGRLRLVRGPWVKTFIEEACSFPHGAHDDQIDAVSLAVSMHDNKGSKLVIF